jgi:hypothetical protein
MQSRTAAAGAAQVREQAAGANAAESGTCGLGPQVNDARAAPV